MVYLELLETSLICFGDEDYTRGRGGRNDEPILSFIVWSPHISDYNHVGKASLMELGEAWYRRYTFMLGPSSEAAELLDTNLWSLGLDPRQHVRHVQIRIESSHYFADYQTTGPEDVFKPRNIDKLRELRNLGSVSIVLDLDAWNLVPSNTRNIEQFVSAMSDVFPTLQAMLDTGCTMVVNVKGAEPVGFKVTVMNPDRWCQLIREGSHPQE
jgi:hypothetical protein